LLRCATVETLVRGNLAQNANLSSVGFVLVATVSHGGVTSTGLAGNPDPSLSVLLYCTVCS
jgi:hypothetical protein